MMIGSMLHAPYHHIACLHLFDHDPRHDCMPPDKPYSLTLSLRTGGCYSKLPVNRNQRKRIGRGISLPAVAVANSIRLTHIMMLHIFFDVQNKGRDVPVGLGQ